MSEQIIIKPQAGKQELALNIQADVIFIGGSAGSAKSYTLMMRPLSHLEDKNFDGIFFRRTTVQLAGQGGLWDTAQGMYSPFGAAFRQRDMISEFPEGMKLKFSHMQHVKDRIDHQGLQYSAQYWDELTHFEEEQFTYLMSRLRSEAEGDSYVMASMNPDPDSWVLKYVEPYLTEEGYFNEDMLGKILFFFVIDGSPIFAEDADTLIKEYPESAWERNPNTGEMVFTRPKTFTFVGSTIFDNPILLETNPSYLSELKALPEVEKSRLLHGNWYARAEGSNLFKRQWLTNLLEIPKGNSCRAWDKAASESSEVERYPDFTACIKMIRTSEDRFCIVGDFCDTNIERDIKTKEVIYRGRFRKTVGARDTIIEDQAQWDGEQCTVVFPIDVGAAGKVQPLDSKVVTSLGYRDIGSLKEGSYILNPDGVRQRVNKIFPHKNWEFYRVTFNDGSSCEVGKEHLWVSWRADKRTTSGLSHKKLYGDDPYSLYSPYSEVISTEGMIDWMSKGFNPLIPVTVPLEHSFSENKLKINPYTLGVLLGDGCITCSGNNGLRFASEDSEIIDHFTEQGYLIKPDGQCSWFFNRNSLYHELKLGLDKYGLTGTNSSSKFIPHNYLISSLDARVALLQGLMDTDGYVSERGQYEYVTVSKELSGNITRLVQSLGGWNTVTAKQSKKGSNHKIAYRHYIKLPNSIIPFRLTRKISRCTDNPMRLYRTVVSIVPSRVCDGACIMVSNPNRLYMTDNYIVTHNTEFVESSKKLILKGFKVKSDPMPTTKSKTLKFHPFASACENGMVDIVESSFPDKATLNHFYKEMEAFCDERSTRQRKDDIPDACGTAFNHLCKDRVVNIVKRNQKNVATFAKDILHNNNKEQLPYKGGQDVR